MATGQRGRAQAAKLPSLWERLEGQIAWYDRKASANQRAYKWSKVAIIVLAISLPVLAEYGHVGEFERAPAFLVGLAAGAILLLEGLQHLQQMAGELDPPPLDLRGTQARAASPTTRRPAPMPGSSRRRPIACWPSAPGLSPWPSTPNGSTTAPKRPKPPSSRLLLPTKNYTGRRRP